MNWFMLSEFITKSFDFLLQLTIDAYDAATPNIRGSVTVFITVRRNENKPVIEELSYSASINSSLAQGVPIVRVGAQDQDGVR